MTPVINLVSMSNDMINWVWCEDCLEWKNAGEDVAFISIDEFCLLAIVKAVYASPEVIKVFLVLLWDE